MLSRATEKSWIDGGAAVVARADRVQTMTWVMHSSSRTVPAGAMAPGSNVVRLLTTGPSLVKDRSLMRSPTASPSTAPAGSTSAVWPSPRTTVRRSRNTSPDEYVASTSTGVKMASPSSGTCAEKFSPSTVASMPLTVSDTSVWLDATVTLPVIVVVGSDV